MFLNLFKTKLPIYNAFIVLINVLFWISMFFIPNSTIILKSSVNDVLNFINDYNWLSFVASVSVISSTGMMINRMASEYKILKENNMLIALWFVILNVVWLNHISFNGILIGNFFIAWSLYKISSIYNQQRVYRIAFEAGLLIAIASLFYTPFLFVFPIVWLTILIVRTITYRDVLLSLMGVFLPYFYLIMYQWFTTDVVKNPLLSLQNSTNPNFSFFDKIFLVYTGFLLTFSALSCFAYIGHTTVRIRKLFYVFLLLLGIELSFYFIDTIQLHELYFIISIPFSILLANFSMRMKPFFSEILFTVFMLLGLLTYFGSIYF